MLFKDDINNCNRCSTPVVTDYKRGRILCPSCGLLKTSRFVDRTSEYRYFIENTSANGGDPRRVGNLVNTHLDSQIDLIEIDEG